MFWLGVTLFLIYFYRRLHGSEGFTLNEREPIFGVYREPTSLFNLKFLFMYTILKFRKCLEIHLKHYSRLYGSTTNESDYNRTRGGVNESSVDSDRNCGADISLVIVHQLWSYIKFEEDECKRASIHETYEKKGGYGAKSRASPELMECTQPLSSHPKAIDAVYFNGANREGWHFIGATARRPQGVINGFLHVKVPGVGLLVAPKLPDTMMFQEHPSEGFAAEGLEFEPVQPMAAWTVKYDGFLRVKKSESSNFEVGKLLKVKIDALWNSHLPYFDFDTDMSASSVARSMATEPWSRDYFNLLKSLHQTHYEQFGDLRGYISIENERHDFDVQTVRDHSYGEFREWKNFHRYALHFIVLETGVRIHVGVVSMPIVFSSMEIGYMYTADGKVNALDSHTFRLHEHGESRSPPTDYAFSFSAGGEVYHVKVQATESTSFNIGWDWEAQIIENFCQFEVNGVKGWGCVEFQYRHLSGRPQSYADTDPVWSKQLVKG